MEGFGKQQVSGGPRFARHILCPQGLPFSQPKATPWPERTEGLRPNTTIQLASHHQFRPPKRPAIAMAGEIRSSTLACRSRLRNPPPTSPQRAPQRISRGLVAITVHRCHYSPHLGHLT